MSEFAPLKYPVDVTSYIERFQDEREGVESAIDLIVLANVALKAAGVELVLRAKGETFQTSGDSS